MAVYDLEEQEQISELKAWWARYGNAVTAGLLVAAVAVFGWQGWNWYQRNQAAQASGILAEVQKAASGHDAKTAAARAGVLIEKFPGTTHAVLAVLMSARLQAEGGDVKTAEAQLGWAAENAGELELRDIARLRLANLLLDEKAYDEALKLLEREPAPTFSGRFHEMRGDIHAVQGKGAEAKKSYEAAIAQFDEVAKAAPAGAVDERQKAILQLKLESLGVGA